MREQCQWSHQYKKCKGDDQGAYHQWKPDGELPRHTARRIGVLYPERDARSHLSTGPIRRSAVQEHERQFFYRLLEYRGIAGQGDEERGPTRIGHHLQTGYRQTGEGRQRRDAVPVRNHERKYLYQKQRKSTNMKTLNIGLFFLALTL